MSYKSKGSVGMQVSAGQRPRRLIQEVMMVAPQQSEGEGLAEIHDSTYMAECVVVVEVQLQVICTSPLWYVLMELVDSVIASLTWFDLLIVAPCICCWS